MDKIKNKVTAELFHLWVNIAVELEERGIDPFKRVLGEYKDVKKGKWIIFKTENGEEKCRISIHGNFRDEIRATKELLESECGEKIGVTVS